MLDRTGRLDARHAPLPLDGRGQRAAFPADKRPRSLLIRIRKSNPPERIFSPRRPATSPAPIAVFSRFTAIGYSARTYNIAIMRAAGKPGDHHALDHPERSPSMTL
jgi:hypothetical protein